MYLTPIIIYTPCVLTFGFFFFSDSFHHFCPLLLFLNTTFPPQLFVFTVFIIIIFTIIMTLYFIFLHCYLLCN